MRAFRTAAITTIIALSFSVPSMASRRGGLPQEHKAAPVNPRNLFQGLYNQANNALSAKDLDGFLMFHSSDFVEVRNGAEHDLGDKRFRLSAWLDLAQSAHGYTSVTSASIHGNNGSTLAKQEVMMVLINPDTRTTGTFIYRVSEKDTWIHGDDGWLLQRSEVLSESATNNGKKVYDITDPFAPAPPKDDNDDSSTQYSTPSQPSGPPPGAYGGGDGGGGNGGSY